MNTRPHIDPKKAINYLLSKDSIYYKENIDGKDVEGYAIKNQSDIKEMMIACKLPTGKEYQFNEPYFYKSPERKLILILINDRGVLKAIAVLYNNQSKINLEAKIVTDFIYSSKGRRADFFALANFGSAIKPFYKTDNN